MWVSHGPEPVVSRGWEHAGGAGRGQARWPGGQSPSEGFSACSQLPVLRIVGWIPDTRGVASPGDEFVYFLGLDILFPSDFFLLQGKLLHSLPACRKVQEVSSGSRSAGHRTCACDLSGTVTLSLRVPEPPPDHVCECPVSQSPPCSTSGVCWVCFLFAIGHGSFWSGFFFS